MRILQIIPGTGNFYCGSCIRDTTLLRSLKEKGHDVVMQSLYLPLYTEDMEIDTDGDIFFGGINVYLQQKLDWFQKSPRWLDSLLDSKWLLSLSAKKAGMTKASELGELTVSMFKGKDGRQFKELNRLIDFLKTQDPFDVVLLSNGMLLGIALGIKEALNVPVVCTLQGEDGFLDNLPEPFKSEAWNLFSTQANQADHLIAVSHYYGNLMKERLALTPEKFTIVPNGINVSGYDEPHAKTQPMTLGYLARMCEVKGLRTLVEAFIQLKELDTLKSLKLKIAGTMNESDQPFVDELKAKLEKKSLLQDVEFYPNIPREEKIAFLQSLSAFSVPATYGESFGLYVIEALAAGTPVVQPRHAGFVEILETTQGGRFYEPDNLKSYVTELATILTNPEEGRQMGLRGQQKVFEYYTLERMTDDVCNIMQAATKTVSI